MLNINASLWRIMPMDSVVPSHTLFRINKFLCSNKVNEVAQNKNVCWLLIYKLTAGGVLNSYVHSPAPWACRGCCPWTSWSPAWTATRAAPWTSATSRRWRSCSASSFPCPEQTQSITWPQSCEMRGILCALINQYDVRTTGNSEPLAAEQEFLH